MTVWVEQKEESPQKIRTKRKAFPHTMRKSQKALQASLHTKAKKHVWQTPPFSHLHSLKLRFLTTNLENVHIRDAKLQTHLHDDFSPL